MERNIEFGWKMSKNGAILVLPHGDKIDDDTELVAKLTEGTAFEPLGRTLFDNDDIGETHSLAS